MVGSMGGGGALVLTDEKACRLILGVRRWENWWVKAGEEVDAVEDMGMPGGSDMASVPVMMAGFGFGVETHVQGIRR